MALVRAKKAVYLGEHGGYREEDEQFEYAGPDNHNLEAVGKSKADQEDDEDTKYHAFTREELKAELDKRGIDYAANAGDKNLRQKLEADDDK